MKCNESNYIKHLKKKKEDALEFIADKYFGFVKRVVYKVLGPLHNEEAMEECINDIFLAVWKHSEKFEGGEEDFKKWIYKVSKFQAIDYYRKLTKRTEVSLEDECAGQEESAEEHFVINETREELLALINTLEPTDQKIFMMKYFLGIRSEEIGRQLGLSRTAVDNRVYRGKKKLNHNVVSLGWEVI